MHIGVQCKKNMKRANTIELPLAILDILNKQSDENNIISMPDLLVELEEYGFSCDRRTAYKAIALLKKYGSDISYKQIHRKQGYYLNRQLSDAELSIILYSLYDASSLSLKDTKKIEDKLLSINKPLNDLDIPRQLLSTNKTTNTYVLDNISLLLKAIKNNDDISFRYYDLTITKEKKYRKDKKKYILTPYAITSLQGRYYTIMYNEAHNTFNTYRIDKMDTLNIIQSNKAKIQFNLEAYLRNSFQMYTGEASTITLKCDIEMASIIFDQFGKNIIVSNVKDKYFIASIRTSITPTLISWIIQFYDRIEIQSPKELIDELKKIAKHINKVY